VTTPTQRRWGYLAFAILAASLLWGPALVNDARGHAPDAAAHNWRVSNASFYGPNFYGRRTACGQTMTRQLMGVAHKTLPCGTLVRFEWHGNEVVVPVTDRGPFTHGREWDLTSATCHFLSQNGRPNRCVTAPIAWTR